MSLTEFYIKHRFFFCMESISEKEKMLTGELYFSGDKILTQERHRAKILCHQYNHSSPDQEKLRKSILSQLLGKIDFPIYLEPPFYCDYGYNIHLRERVYMNHGCVLLDVNQIEIGANTMFGPYVQVLTATHPLDPTERLMGKEYGRPISIGKNVWVGGGAILCPGVKIGDNAVIGAGAVVTKDIPSNYLAVGTPCKATKPL